MTFGVYTKIVAAAVATGMGSLFAQVDFSHTITLGSILVGIAVAGGAFVFTLRSRVATIWQQEARGYREKSERLEKELAQEKLARAVFDREQQELRHALKDDLSACKAALEVEQAKAALTAVQSAAVDSVTVALQDLGRKIEAGQAEQKTLLSEIRDSVKAREEKP